MIVSSVTIKWPLTRVQGNGSGLLGLAFSSINTVTPTQQKTPVDNMIAQKDVSQQLFTANLGSWRDANERRLRARADYGLHPPRAESLRDQSQVDQKKVRDYPARKRN